MAIGRGIGEHFRCTQVIKIFADHFHMHGHAAFGGDTNGGIVAVGLFFSLGALGKDSLGEE